MMCEMMLIELQRWKIKCCDSLLASFILGQALHVAHKQAIRLAANMRSVQGTLK